MKYKILVDRYIVSTNEVTPHLSSLQSPSRKCGALHRPLKAEGDGGADSNDNDSSTRYASHLSSFLGSDARAGGVQLRANSSSAHTPQRASSRPSNTVLPNSTAQA